jgi:ribosomal protein S18 acetylase RimI-like enzyme
MKRYRELSHCQKEKLLEFLCSVGNPLLPNTMEDMEDRYGSHAYEDGNTHWSIWREERPVVVLGAVTEAREAKGEVYLTGICVGREDFNLLDRLLSHACHVLRAGSPCVLKLGTGIGIPGLSEWAVGKGFTPTYRLLEMAWNGMSENASACEDCLSERSPPLRWEPLCEANAEVFRETSNAAFLHSPNGGVLDQEGVADLIRKHAGRPSLLQVGYVHDKPAVTLQLELRHGSDGVGGVIDGLAVAPGFQGKGLGRAGLRRGINTLRTLGAASISLTVMDSNLPAVSLYLKSGFRQTRVLSSWFSRSLDTSGAEAPSVVSFHIREKGCR